MHAAYGVAGLLSGSSPWKANHALIRGTSAGEPEHRELFHLTYKDMKNVSFSASFS